MLCSVTASISIVVLFTFSLMVNFSLFFITIFSSFSSVVNKFSISSQIAHSFFLLFLFSIFSARLFTPINVTIPIIKPTEAGNHAVFLVFLPFLLMELEVTIQKRLSSPLQQIRAIIFVLLV